MKRHATAARSRLAMYTLDTFVSLISASLSLCLTNRILCCVVVCTRRVVRWCDARRRELRPVRVHLEQLGLLAADARHVPVG